MAHKGQKSHTNDPKRHGHSRTEGEQDLDVSDIQNLDTHHEQGDINTSGVYKFLLWLAFGTAMTYVLVYFMMRWNDNRAAKMNAEFTHVAKLDNQHVPAEPRLQLLPGHPEHPLDDGKRYRDSVQQYLASYGYINRQAGQVHIPIELAKDLALSRGFAVRPQTQAAVTALMIPAFTNGGRTLVPREQRIPREAPTATTTESKPE